MAFVVLKGEKKLADVVSRAYGDLKAADMKRAQAALVRANPQLGKLRELKAGAVIVVPAIPGVRPTEEGASREPAAESVVQLRNTLDVYRKRLNETVAAERTAVTELASLIKSKELTAVARALPESAAYIKRVAGAAKDRGAEVDELTAFLKVIAKARTDLDDLAKKLS